jgi:transcription initiation factor TFIIIB Brf1 subunit/transcription initiation factor TFIIB
MMNNKDWSMAGDYHEEKNEEYILMAMEGDKLSNAYEKLAEAHDNAAKAYRKNTKESLVHGTKLSGTARALEMRLPIKE